MKISQQQSRGFVSSMGRSLQKAEPQASTKGLQLLKPVWFQFLSVCFSFLLLLLLLILFTFFLFFQCLSHTSQRCYKYLRIIITNQAFSCWATVWEIIFSWRILLILQNHLKYFQDLQINVFKPLMMLITNS